MVATPLQIASATSALASKGHYFYPRMTRLIGEQPVEFESGLGGEHDIVLKDQRNWDRMRDAMRKVITDSHGTARRLQGTDYDIAGKTGTGQVFSLQEDEEYDSEKLAKRLHDHALFIGFAPAQNPKISVFAIFENGGSSSKPADLTRQLFDAYLHDDYPDRYDYLKGKQND
jgi:penicillin-binding protein 2